MSAVDALIELPIELRGIHDVPPPLSRTGASLTCGHHLTTRTLDAREKPTSHASSKAGTLSLAKLRTKKEAAGGGLRRLFQHKS
jgi:hypothetical protein